MTVTDLIFFVNGRKVIEKHADPETSLLTYLRTKLRLTGTKLGCGEGGCGACTVMLSRYDKQKNTISHCAINACLAPVCSMHGMAVTTIEGIGSIQSGLHPVQEKIIQYHGSQCGFCTPGIVMKMYTLLRNHPQPTETLIDNAFQGNLCRCTGYRPILDAFRTFTKAPVVNGESEYLPTDVTQDPIFPVELRDDIYDKESLMFIGERITWYRPTTIDQLLKLKAENANAVIVAGNTEIGVDIAVKKMVYPVMISISHIPELKTIELTDNHVVVGANACLTDIDSTFRQFIENLPEYKSRGLVAFIEMIQWFAGDQIRNVASIGGNIMTSSPISDLNPLLVALGSDLNLKSKDDGIRSEKMHDNWFVSYRKTSVKPKEVLISVSIPLTHKNEFIFGYKQAHRKEDDISIVNAGMRVLFEGESNIVENAYLAFGGMSYKLVTAKNTMKSMIGRKWDSSLLNECLRLLPEDLPLSINSPGGMAEYRQTLALSFFFKFFMAVQSQYNISLETINGFVPEKVDTGSDKNVHPRKSTQVYEAVPEDQSLNDDVGRCIPHTSGLKQATGEAVYIDDMPSVEGEVHMAFVTSSKAHAKLINVDVSGATKCQGFIGYVGHKDIAGKNEWGIIVPDEEFFASDKVTCIGQIIGAVLADTKLHARRAAELVHVEYEELPPIITISDAIKAGSFFGDIPPVTTGNMENGFESCDHILEGEACIGGQDHWYLETQAVIALPKNEDSEIEMFVSTQSPTLIQDLVSKALGIAANKIVVRVKRMGGGFGGKESRTATIAVPVAVAASRFKRPVRCVLDRQEDMVMIGNRHPFLGKYKVGFMKNGKIIALDLQLYSNAGNSVDLSAGVMSKALLRCTNCYNIPNMYVKGRLCKTNIPSNTAFRGFGAPQAVFIAESYVDHVTRYLQKDAIEIKKLNMYQEGETTHYKQPLDDCPIQKCWEECLKRSEYLTRKNEIEQYNSTHRWKKRGIAIIPIVFGLAFHEAVFLNQAGALVHIYLDGSVLISHGGTEMGQGLHTKMLQVASRVLGIQMSKIHISETSTASVPNTTSTAASISSDLNGMAVKNACDVLMKRLAPYIDRNKQGSWEDWVQAAYFDRVSLSSTGFYKTPDIYFDMETQSGRPYNYHCTGTACSEVEIDCLTGDHKLIRTDIVMDVGQSLNPSIDIGQIEGAFIQGYGLYMLEQLKTSPSGYNYTRGPGSYKIPGFNNTPAEFNVALLKGSKHLRAVYSSKAVGEPPLLLSSSVFFATKNAIASARQDEGLDGPFRLDSPATPERIRMACRDKILKNIQIQTGDEMKPWFVDL